MMQTAIKLIAQNFIEEIWNQRRLQDLDKFLHPEFADHSLPPGLPANQDGLKTWISATGKSFEHQSLIEDTVTEGNKIILKIRMKLKHVGTWRGIEASGKEIETTGYRYLFFQGNKILKHWAQIDGESIANQLLKEEHGCKVPV